MFTIQDFVSGQVKTLGWGVLEWCSKWLVIPDRDDKGNQWEFTTEQALFILNFYAVKDNGKWHFNRAMLSRPKGWGKSPVLAALACAEFLGPVRFSHWGVDGRPVGKQVATPHVIISAVTQDQAMKTTMVLIREMLAGPARDEFGLEINLTLIRDPHGGLLEVTPTNAKAGEGLRPTFLVMDETHHWVEKEAIEFANTVRRNLGKGGSNRAIESTNAPVPGQGSVAEATDLFEQKILAGLVERTLLYDSTEVYIEDIYDKESAMAALSVAYGDSTAFVDLERIWEEINDPATSEPDARRFYFNQRVLLGSQWLNPKSWMALADPQLEPLSLTDRIAIGFRGQARKGSTAIVACRLSDNALFVLKSWETSDQVPEISHREVDGFMRLCFEMYNVVFMYASPQNWQDIIGRWYEENEDVVEEFWTNQKLRYAKAIEQFETAVYGKRITHNGDEILKRHVANAQSEELPNEMHVIRKATETSTYYISVAEAAVLAFDAAQEAIQRGLDTEGSSDYVYSF